MSGAIYSETQTFLASSIILPRKPKSKNQSLFSNSTKLNCRNAAVRHKHTAQFSQSKPTSTHILSDSVSDTLAFQVTAACYCVGQYTECITQGEKYACDAGAHTKSSATGANQL